MIKIDTPNVEIIPSFTKEQFLNGTEPFEYVYGYKDQNVRHLQIINIISDMAKGVGIRNFMKMYKSYESLVNSKNGVLDDNVTEFEGQEQELLCGDWQADDYGIVGRDRQGFEIVACNHPITIVQRIINIDTGAEKLKVAYKKGGQWKSIVADKEILANNNKILQLANYIGVNSENSKHLVKYLTDLEYLNYDRIKEVNSVSRMGWIEGYGFSPYIDGLVLDADSKYQELFNSVSQKGSFTEWVDFVKDIRGRRNIITNLTLAASFSSVLVEICEALPFFFHLWGGSETGKSVSTMVGASVWAYPVIGYYYKTFNSTIVGNELTASFVNSMPLMLDELQIEKARKDFDYMIYTLCEGTGKTRGRKDGGLQQTGKWRNCIMTTGEMPISNGNSGGGAVNRVIEIDCKDQKLLKDPRGVVSFIKKHYGHAGKYFVELLMSDENKEYAREIQKEYYTTLTNGESTEKQALSASIILTADRLIDEWIFKDGIRLSVSDIEPYLSTKKEVSANERALEYIYDFVGVNARKFDLLHYSDDKLNEVWGAIDDKYIYINKFQFDKVMRDEGYNPAAFLSWAKEQNLIRTSSGKSTVAKRLLGNVCRCVCLVKRSEEECFDYE